MRTFDDLKMRFKEKLHIQGSRLESLKDNPQSQEVRHTGEKGGCHVSILASYVSEDNFIGQRTPSPSLSLPHSLPPFCSLFHPIICCLALHAWLNSYVCTCEQLSTQIKELERLNLPTAIAHVRAMQLRNY